MKKITLLFFLAIIILCAGCTGKLPTGGKDNRLYSIDPAGELNYEICIDCGYMNTATSIIEDREGNLIVGGAGVSETFNGSRPEIIRVDQTGQTIDKMFYETGDDRWITTLSNDTASRIFAVCYSGKSLILNETGAPAHVIVINATGPGWWVSLNTPEGYAAASMNEAFAVSDNGKLLWHTVFRENETSTIRPLFFVNDNGNYIVASPYNPDDQNNVLPVELDKNGNIIQKNVSIDADLNNYRSNFCKNGRCCAEIVRSDNFLFIKGDYFLRLVATDPFGDVIFDKRYKTGDFYNDVSNVIETSDGGYAVLIEAWN
jgi:hypothetical protein